MTTPQTPTDPDARQFALVDYLTRHRTGFTIEALRASALAGGYTADEIDAAIRLADQREIERQTFGPLRRRARNVILLAYGLVWLAFGIAFVGQSSGNMYMPDGIVLQIILTIALGIGLAISLLIARHGRPDSERPTRAVVLLLVVPVVLLLGVAGLCLPAVGQG